MSEKVKVRISLTETLRYNQTVEMSREDYDYLLEKLDDGNRMAGELISAYLDPRDVSDSQIDPDDVDEFELVEELK